MKSIQLLINALILFSVSAINAQQVLTLEQCKQLALENNARIKNSRLEIDASHQIKKSAFTNYFPSLSAGGFIWSAQKNLMEIESKGGNLPVYDGDPANLMSATQFAYFPNSVMGMMKKGKIGFLNAVQPVFTGGRIYNGNRLASLGEEVSEQKYRLSEEEIRLKTEEQYWMIISLNEKTRTVNKYEELLNRLLAKVDDAYNSGLVLKNDVLKVKLKLSEIQLNKSKLDNGRKLAMMAFCQYLGITYDVSTHIQDSLISQGIPLSYYVNKEDALTKRPEYSLLIKSVEAEKLQTNMKLGEYLPQAGIGLTAMYMKFDDTKDRTLGMAFGTVSIPISGWWGASHELEERSIKEEIAANNYKDNSELLILQIEKAWQDLNDAYKQELLSREAVVQAEENMKVNDDSYKNGLTTISDLLEAQAMLQNAKDQLTEAKTSYNVKIAQYLKVTGRSK